MTSHYDWYEGKGPGARELWRGFIQVLATRTTTDVVILRCSPLRAIAFDPFVAADAAHHVSRSRADSMLVLLEAPRAEGLDVLTGLDGVLADSTRAVVLRLEGHGSSPDEVMRPVDCFARTGLFDPLGIQSMQVVAKEALRLVIVRDELVVEPTIGP